MAPLYIYPRFPPGPRLSVSEFHAVTADPSASSRLCVNPIPSSPLATGNVLRSPSRKERHEEQMACNASRTGTKTWKCRCCDARADYEYWACGRSPASGWSGASPAAVATTRRGPGPARTADRIVSDRRRGEHLVTPLVPRIRLGEDSRCQVRSWGRGFG